MLPAPGFHHLHLNSVDPDSAIDFYVRQFPASAKARWGGLPALAAPNNVLVLFTRVVTPPPTAPQSAIWHFGWHVTDTRASLESYKARPAVTLLPLYTTEAGGSVFVRSDTWPRTGRTPRLTKAQIAEAQASGVQPTRIGGFGYMEGPDHALVEYAGNHAAERFNHVHMYQDDPSVPSSGTRRTSMRRCAPGAPARRRSPKRRAGCRAVPIGAGPLSTGPGCSGRLRPR